MNGLIHKSRIFLIRLGKMLPFVVCAIICTSYVEDVYALLMEDYVLYDGAFVLNKPISWALGSVFEYNLITVALMAVISISTETCYWNKIAVLFTLLQLGEKTYFDFEIEPWAIYIICLVNIVVAGYLTLKGIKILLK